MKISGDIIATAGGLVLLGLASFFNGGVNGGMEEAQQRAELIRTTRADQALKLDALELSQDYADQAAVIAEHRFNNGCVFVVSQDNWDAAVSVIEGEAVIDFWTKAPLPDGSIVCDVVGNTGEMVNGVVARTAFTGNWEVLEAARLRAGFKPTNTTVQEN